MCSSKPCQRNVYFIYKNIHNHLLYTHTHTKIGSLNHQRKVTFISVTMYMVEDGWVYNPYRKEPNHGYIGNSKVCLKRGI